jgi:excisionase family DNA binding protein
MAEQLLTIPECAALLAIRDRTIYRWIKSGKIKPRKKYGVTLIRKCDCKRPDGLDNRGAHMLGRKIAKGGGE